MQIAMNRLLNLYPRPRFVSTSLLPLICVIKLLLYLQLVFHSVQRQFRHQTI